MIPLLNCSVADWGRSFNEEGWSKCGKDSLFITGFYRGSSDSISSLQKAKCCNVKKGIGSDGGTCEEADWQHSLKR